LYLLALLIAMAMMAVLVIRPAPVEAEPEGGGWAVRAGDVLRYSVEGQRNGTAVVGSAIANFTTVNMTGSGGSVGGHFYSDVGNWTGKGLASALCSPSSGGCMGWERIVTAFGTKVVTKYVNYHDDNATGPSVTMVYAGVDSRLIYRINISGLDFFLNLNLESSPVEGMEGLDTSAPADLPIGFMRPTEDVIIEHSMPGTVFVGFWDMPAGTVFSHTLEGDGAIFYVFTERDLERMEHGGVLEGAPELSLTSGNGTRSAVLGGGLYVVVTDLTASTEITRQRLEITYPS